MNYDWTGIAERLDRAMTRTGQAARELEDKGHFPYIPLPISIFLEQLEQVANLINISLASFIDVGCGVGTKCLLAKERGFGEVTGIEINPDYVAIARNMHKFEVLQEDAIKHSYESYDVIYFYCPMRDDKLEARLERRILKTAKPGAIILANNAGLDKLRGGLYRTPNPVLPFVRSGESGKELMPERRLGRRQGGGR